MPLTIATPRPSAVNWSISGQPSASSGACTAWPAPPSARILPQERFHERAFRSLATPESLERTWKVHALGRAVRGLTP